MSTFLIPFSYFIISANKHTEELAFMNTRVCNDAFLSPGTTVIFLFHSRTRNTLSIRVMAYWAKVKKRRMNSVFIARFNSP